jgi:hypothetical protein
MIVAFDIDGTISNGAHREHLAHEKRWDEFHALAHLDKPLPETMAVLRALESAGHSIEIWTARPDTYMAQTREWLLKQLVPFDKLLMRKAGDWRRAFILKLEWYLQREPHERPQLVFEDHPETTRLLRAAGCCVHHVADREGVQS